MGSARYGSDVVVDALRAFGVPWVAFNPGASFRGLHDSLVNYQRDGGDRIPGLLEVPHEKIAVGMAHGFAKATGQPMAVVTHDLVGLLHATMGVYCAWIDRVPMLLLGGAGPMDAARRRPWIDWVHTANVQNAAVRDFTKWDDHPFSVEALPDALARAWRVATAQPQGPVYVALDADIQETPTDGQVLPVPPSEHPPSGIAPDPVALDRAARALVAAERPAIVAGYAARDPAACGQLVALAELLGAALVDTGIRLNVPTRHPQNLTGTGILDDADLIALVDVKDAAQHTGLLGKEARGRRLELPHGVTLVDVGFGDLGLSSWSTDFGGYYQADVAVLADTALALPMLLDRCRTLQAGAPERRPARQRRRQHLAALHQDARAGWAAQARRAQTASPIALPHLAAEVGAAVAPYDWVLTAGTANGWATRLWDVDRPDRHPGRSLGTATQIGISLGVALAHRGRGRLVVDLQPDGDLLFDTGALWVASRHRIPLLVVMVNNRAYGNDWTHQRRVAEARGRPVANAGVGIRIDDPPPDFAAVARGFGWWADGPVTDPAAVGAAVRAAARVVAETGRPALVDVVCAPEDG